MKSAGRPLYLLKLHARVVQYSTVALHPNHSIPVAVQYSTNTVQYNYEYESLPLYDATMVPVGTGYERQILHRKLYVNLP